MDLTQATNKELTDEVLDIHSLKRMDAYNELMARMVAVQVDQKKGFDQPTITPPIP
jgi:hypothetical protein